LYERHYDQALSCLRHFTKEEKELVIRQANKDAVKNTVRVWKDQYDT